MDNLTRLGVGIEALALAGQSFPIWMIRADRPLDPCADGLLTLEERQRADRFALERLRRRYVAAHIALHALLGRHFGLSAQEQRISIGGAGKPFLPAFPGLHWSLSYSGDAAVIGLSPGKPIGVDIEQLRQITDAEGLADVHFTSDERHALDPARGADALSGAFLAIWVRKEACIKAVGEGLAIPLTQVHCGVGYEEEEVRIGHYRLRTSAALAPAGHVVGWATIM